MKSLLISLAALSSLSYLLCQTQCPRFECTKTQAYCINVTTVGNQTESNRSVYLSRCEDDKQNCPHIGNFWKNDGITKCKDIPVVETSERYPGEPCDEDIDCYGEAKCVDSKCNGKKFNETCFRDLDCVAGLYCHTEEGKDSVCLKQVPLKGQCTREYQCGNNAFCHNSTCVEYYSLEVGTVVDQLLDLDMACKYGYLKDGKTCAERKYKGEVTDGVVKCNYGDVCEYDVDGQTVNMTCQCGYNANGQGYCPYDHKNHEKVWSSFYTKLRQVLDNQCHTVNRFTCPESHLNSARAQKHDTEVVYHKAVNCAKAVLNAGFLSVSVLALVSLLI